MTILVTFMLIFLSQVACRVRLDYNPKLDSLVAYNGSTGINLKINF